MVGGHHLQFFLGDSPLCQGDYLDLLARGGRFAQWYTRQLRQFGEQAFFWEHPPMTLATAAQAAELVLLDAPSLAGVQADGAPFAEHFAVSQKAVCAFSSLGGDAQLVAPCPRSAEADYGHLGAFLRSAPEEQIEALWVATARAVQSILQRQAVLWLSTSGLGVHWLHVRLDRRPKYYQHRPYAHSRK